MPMSSEYPVVIEPLSEEDGGGFVATVPDLPGCMSDGETREEAARNIADAISAWIEEASRLGRAIPAPSAHLAMAGE
jgi:predicted RNase H-like HicB family nuclease